MSFFNDKLAQIKIEREKMGALNLFIKNFFHLKSPIEQAFDLAQNKQKFNEKKFFQLINKNDSFEDILNGKYAPSSLIDLNTTDKNGNTLLHLLAGHSFLSEYLIKKGASAFILNNQNQTPLAKNIATISEKDVLLVRSTPKQVFDSRQTHGETILTDLFQKNDRVPLKLVQEIVEKTNDINRPNQQGHTPLYYAARHTAVSPFKVASNYSNFLLLISRGAKFNQKDLNEINLFNKIQHQSFVVLGFPDNFKLTSKDQHGDTILFKMLKSPIDYSFEEHSLFLFSENETLKERVIEKVISLSDLSQKDKEGHSALETALNHHRYPFIIPLIKHGADLSFVNENQETLLHFAVLRGNKQMLESILKRKELDVNAPDKNGNTPLHLAVMKENTDLIDLLLTYDANPLIQNKNHQSVLDLGYKTSLETIPLKLKIKQLEIENNRLSKKLISRNEISSSPSTERQRTQ